MFGLLPAFIVISALVSHSLGFGLTVSGDNFIVDTSGGLVFTVNSKSGDITSMKFNGIETQDSSKRSHINSGIGATCTQTRLGNNNNYIKITCEASGITQYYVAQYKSPTIHMATHITAEPSVGELRFIARLKASALSNPMLTGCDISGTSTIIEGKDVFSINGQTRSKFYSSKQFIDDQVHGVIGNGIAAYMIIPGNSYESSSGGPFFRDINNQRGSQNELYWYMNSGHAQTEAYRMGLHGPYALTFTTGAEPSASLDTSFWAALDVKGYVPTAERGRVTGRATGVTGDYYTVGFSNSAAQYWVRCDSSGRFTSPHMKPGKYDMTLYKMELEVKKQSVTVAKGQVVTQDIQSGEVVRQTIWQTGDYDGTPRGFLNADLIERMHPSDARMKSWGPITYTVGQPISSFPMAIFKAIGGVTIKFDLTSAQLGARTLEIGTTLAFAGGRPQVKVNSWTGPAPAAPSQPDSRGVTRGTWRGNNIAYTVNIPAGTLVAGTNTVVINVISGSSGNMFLSPNIIFDMVRLY